MTDDELRDELWHDAYWEMLARQMEYELRAAFMVQDALAEKQNATVH